MTNGVSIVSPETTWISPETEIGQDTIIYPSTYIEGKNIIAVQWHPEKIYDIDDQKKIFDYFICMCKGQC